MTDANLYAPKRMRVKVRRDARFGEVRESVRLIDGNVYTFNHGWLIEYDENRYPGEIAYIPNDPAYPIESPPWIASGDLVFESETESKEFDNEGYLDQLAFVTSDMDFAPDGTHSDADTHQDGFGTADYSED